MLTDFDWDKLQNDMLIQYINLYDIHTLVPVFVIVTYKLNIR